MLFRDDVPHNSRLHVPIHLTVQEVDFRPQHPSDVECTATVEDGQELLLVIWNMHDVDHHWVEGDEYTISGGRGYRISTGGGEHVALHSTNVVRVRDTDWTRPTRLLVFDDSHVGYRYRPDGTNLLWRGLSIIVSRSVKVSNAPEKRMSKLSSTPATYSVTGIREANADSSDEKFAKLVGGIASPTNRSWNRWHLSRQFAIIHLFDLTGLNNTTQNF